MGNLYDRIERMGKEHGFKNITELCRSAGVSRASMTELKMGRSKDLSKQNALKLSRALNVSLEEIYGVEQKEKPLVNDDEELTEYLEVLKNRPDMRMLFKLSKNATKEDVEQAVKIIEALRKE